MVYTFSGYRDTVSLPCVDHILLLRLKHIYYIVRFPEMVQTIGVPFTVVAKCQHSTEWLVYFPSSPQAVQNAGMVF